MLIGLPGHSLNLKVEIRSFPFCLLRLTKVHDLFISRFLGMHTVQLFNFLSTHISLEISCNMCLIRGNVVSKSVRMLTQSKGNDGNLH